MRETTDRLLLLAATLATSGVDLVVVGGTARAVVAPDQRPADLDIATLDSQENLRRLAEALGHLRSRPLVPDLPLAGEGPSHFTTSFGPLDVFLQRQLVEDPLEVTIAGITVRVARTEVRGGREGA